MTDEFSKIISATEKSYRDHFLPFLMQEIEGFKNFINEFNQTYQSYLLKSEKESKDQNFQHLLINHKSLLTELLQINEKYFKCEKKYEYSEDFKSLEEDFKNFIPSLKKTKELVIDRNHYRRRKHDNPKVITFKFFIRLRLNLIIFINKALNLFRKPFRKETKDVKKFRRIVPFREMTQYYLRDHLFEVLFTLYDDIAANLAKCLFRLSESRYTFEEYIQVIIQDSDFEKSSEILSGISVLINEQHENSDKLVDSIHARFNQFIKLEIERYLSNYRKVGTFELPARLYSENRVKEKHQSVVNKYLRTRREWNNLLHAISEDWMLDLELMAIKYTAIKESRELLYSQAIKPDGPVFYQFEIINKLIVGTSERIEEFTGDNSDICSFLKEQNLHLKDELYEKALKNAIELLFVHYLPSILEDKKKEIEKSVQKVAEKRILVPGLNISKPLRSSDISYISLKELIFYESLPELTLTMENLREYAADSIDKIKIELQEVYQIADYSIDSALNMDIGSEDSFKEKMTKVVQDGLTRSLRSLADTREKIIHLHSETSDKLVNAIGDFTALLDELTDNENAFELRYRIAKAKTIKTSIRLRNKIIEKLLTIWNLSKKAVNWLLSTGTTYSEQLSKFYSQTDQDSYISTEISNFLSRTKTSINRLPFVYQRLFNLEPLKDSHLLQIRQEEFMEMQRAYRNWQLGHFAPLVVVAEKGAGITTLLNHFLNESIKEYFIVNLSDFNDCDNEKNFYKALGNALNVDSVQSIEKLSEYLNSLEEPVSILIEGLQFLFLKKVKGFESLNRLLELISRTNKKVFWLATCTLYAWQYLTKTMNIAEYFAYIIKLKPFTDEEMIELIQKRHKVSGYKMKFLPSQADSESSRFNKMTEDQQQAYLEKKYYASLNTFAKSNTSIALLFWLRSTSQVKDDVIYIGPMSDFDLSFFNSLKNEKMFCLHALLLHDGLSLEQYSQVMNQSADYSRLQLMQMVDDGLLLLKGERYYINLLLYRSTINLLKAQNIIY